MTIYRKLKSSQTTYWLSRHWLEVAPQGFRCNFSSTLSGDDRDWTWDLPDVKQMLFHWTITPVWWTPFTLQSPLEKRLRGDRWKLERGLWHSIYETFSSNLLKPLLAALSAVALLKISTFFSTFYYRKLWVRWIGLGHLSCTYAAMSTWCALCSGEGGSHWGLL